MKTKYEKPMAISVRGTTVEGDGVDTCYSGSSATGELVGPGDCTVGASAAGHHCMTGTVAAGGGCVPGASVYGCVTGLHPHTEVCGDGGNFV